MFRSSLILGLSIIFFTTLFYTSCNSSSTEIRTVTGTDLADTLKSDEGFTGVYKSFHPDGYLYSEVSYLDGKKDGISKRFYSDGKVHSIIEYKGGKKIGVSKWFYTSGEVYRETPYTDGKIDGIQKKLYRDGTIQAEIPFVNGDRKIGLKEYNERGTLRESYPEIEVRTVDRISTHGRYTVELRLSNNSKKVKFYLNAVSDSLFLPDGKNYLLTEDGIGRMDFIHKESGGYTRDLNLVALYRTRNGNQKIIQKNFRLPSDHLAY